ncbi:Hypothetical protein R9X50_00014500 [Acrodontium crateriforme]|uniref:Uncharacterized protein n=1 Tax=Acrodontium crateriforme TaxID=150365 RepID=A0AAQ3M038_9PEZI|nr:Hypothetical protein R9X50_00014500 [Acrodontium crateriforme]
MDYDSCNSLTAPAAQTLSRFDRNGRQRKCLQKLWYVQDEDALAKAVVKASRDLTRNGGFECLAPKDIRFTCGEIWWAMGQSSSDQDLTDVILQSLDREKERDETSNAYDIRNSKLLRSFRCLASISQADNNLIIGEALYLFLESDLDAMLLCYDEEALSALALAIYHMKTSQNWKLSFFRLIFRERQDVFELLDYCSVTDVDSVASLGHSIISGRMNGGRSSQRGRNRSLRQRPRSLSFSPDVYDDCSVQPGLRRSRSVPGTRKRLVRQAEKVMGFADDLSEEANMLRTLAINGSLTRKSGKISRFGSYDG